MHSTLPTLRLGVPDCQRGGDESAHEKNSANGSSKDIERVGSMPHASPRVSRGQPNQRLDVDDRGSVWGKGSKLFKVTAKRVALPHMTFRSMSTRPLWLVAATCAPVASFLSVGPIRVRF